MTKHQIVVVGSSNMDIAVKTGHIPVPGETVLGGELLMNPGGKGANQAVAAARLGGHVCFVSRLGDDMFGKQLLEVFRSEDIDIRHVFIDKDHATGTALIAVDERGENSIVVASGANAYLCPEHMLEKREVIEQGDVLLMQLEVPIETVARAAELAAGAGVRVVLNPAPARHIPESVLRHVHLITPNEHEAEMISGVKITDVESARQAAKAIQEKGVENVIITLGSKGALLLEGDRFSVVPAYPVKAVDTTAAGDVFNGALCVALVEGNSFRDATVFASKAAAISVTRFGAQSSIPTRDEITVFFNEIHS